MFASLSFLLGILLGGVVLAVSRRHSRNGNGLVPQTVILGRASLAFGLVAVLSLTSAMWLTRSGNHFLPILWNLSISLGFASVMTGTSAIVKQDRSRPAWAGFLAGLAVALFWLAFAAGNIIGLGK